MRYCVNTEAQSNGDHEVHTRDCHKVPAPRNQADLGEHNSCETAVAKARRMGYNANGCIHCCRKCHTT